MSDVRQPEKQHSKPSRTLRCIALFGGGRWSRVLLPVLRSLLPDDCEIVWITQHGYDRAVAWLADHPLHGLTIHRAIDPPSDPLSPRFEAAIVATAPSTHAMYVHDLVRNHIPTFCEKPLTLDYLQATNLIELARANSVPLGVNLELHYASYLDQFVELVGDQAINQVNIVWLDPWTEQRYGETKHGDFYTSIVHDMWPHCWSLLRRLMRVPTQLQLSDVKYDPIDGVTMYVRSSEWTAQVRLCRRNDQRTRRIELNHGTSVLDFSQEPGCSMVNNKSCAHQWAGPRPLTRALQSFLDVVEHPELLSAWPLQAATCADSVRLAEEITCKLNEIYAARISQLRKSGVELTSPAIRNLIIDAFLPLSAVQGLRWPAITEAQQIDFVKHICTTQQIHNY